MPLYNFVRVESNRGRANIVNAAIDNCGKCGAPLPKREREMTGYLMSGSFPLPSRGIASGQIYHTATSGYRPGFDVPYMQDAIGLSLVYRTTNVDLFFCSFACVEKWIVEDAPAVFALEEVS